MKDKLSLEEKIKIRSEERKNNSQYFVNAFKVDFAEALAKQLEKTKISRAEIAKHLGASRAYITKMLNEVLLAGPNLTMESMAKLAFAVGMKIELKFVPLQTVGLQCESTHLFRRISTDRVSERLRTFPTLGVSGAFQFQSRTKQHELEELLKTVEEKKDETLSLAS